MATTEIEKLERRYADNPQGLTFAPLAEIYRKNGDTGRALELLQAGLELHPNYIPASIVLGRCHWDRGDLSAAEAAFSHVLRLDDENVIALKSLADINERLGRLTDAQRWLNRLISIDRSNEDARQQLARLEQARQQPSAAAALPQEPAAVQSPSTAGVHAPSPPAAPPKAPSPAELESQPDPAALDLTAAIAEPVPPELEPSAPSRPKSELKFLDTTEPPSTSSRQARGPEPEERGVPPQPAPVPGLVVQEFVPPPDSSYRSHPELTQQFGLSEEPSDRLEVETVDQVELRSSGAAEFRVPNAAEELMTPLEMPPAPGLAAEQSAPRIEATPVPAPESPSPRIEAKPERKRSSYSVRETNGQSVADFFRVLLANRPAGGAPSSAARSPNDASTPSTSQPVTPAAPVAPDTGSAADTVSFDDFFGAPAGGSSSVPKGNPDPGKDDLDEFQSWLQNLKR